MRTFTRYLTVMAASLLLPSTVFGAYLLYDDSVFPEKDGWLVTGDPDVPTAYLRSVGEGVFSIEGLAGRSPTVQYRKETTLDSASIAYEWRSRTSNDHGYSSVVLSLMNSGAWSQVIVGWDAHHVTAYFEREAGIISSSTEMALTEGYHIYRLVSDGPMHSLLVDGSPLLSGTLQSPAGLDCQIQFGFGKNSGEVSSLSQWDYILLTTVPEPSFGAVAVGLFVAARLRRYPMH